MNKNSRNISLVRNMSLNNNNKIRCVQKSFCISKNKSVNNLLNPYLPQILYNMIIRVEYQDKIIKIDFKYRPFSLI